MHSVFDSAHIHMDFRLTTEILAGDWEQGTNTKTINDPHGVVDSVITYTWDAGLEQWIESGLMEFFIDEFRSDTLVRHSQKSGDDWIVTMVFRTECTYNAGDQLIEEIFSNGPPGSDSPYRKEEYTLDGSGNRIVTLVYDYDSDWVLSQKSETSYNDQGLILVDTIYSRSGDSWLEQSKRVFSYHENGKTAVSDYYEWNAAGSDWALTSRQEFNYNADWEWSLRMQYNYQLDGTHYGTNRDVYTYHPSGKLLIHESSMYDEESSYYLSWHKEFYSHAGDYFVYNDTMCAGELYAWRGESYGSAGTYRDAFVSVTGLDSIYTLVLSENPAPASFTIDGPSEVVQDQEALYIADENGEVEYSWTVENGTVLSGAGNDSLRVLWESGGSGEVASWAMNEFGCSSDTATLQVHIIGTGIEELIDGSILLYPIPVKDVLRIDSGLPVGRVELLDMEGRMVLATNRTETGVDLSSLESGIYLVRLKDPAGRILGTRKILKE